MTQEIHFEVFLRRRGAKSFALLEARHDRAEAITLAKEAAKQAGVIGVKVTKESFNAEAGTFDSVSIFEEGETDAGKKAADKPTIPCFKPQDLSSAHARSVIARVLKSTLDEWQVVPMELINRADLLEKLEARSTALQHAVQQVAIASAGGNTKAVHELYRQLIDLALRAMDLVAQNARKGRLKAMPKEGLAAFAKQAAGPDFAAALGAAIALHLKPEKGFGAKLMALLDLLEDLPAAEAERLTALEIIDAFISELLMSSASLHDLLGNCEELGDALRILSQIFLGRIDLPEGPRRQTLARLATLFAEEKLPTSKSAVSERLLSEIKSMRRMHPSSFEHEVATIRHLAQRLVYGIGPHLSIENLTEAFSIRSRRLVTPDAINIYLESALTQDEKIERLIDLEENVVGAQSKRVLAGFILPLIRSPKTESQFLEDRAPALQRLKRLADLQAKALKATFDGTDKREIADAISALAAKLEDRAGFFKSLDQRKASTADKAFAFLRLIAHGVLPAGECQQKARGIVATLIRRSDFAETLCPDHLDADSLRTRRDDFKDLFERAGLAPKPKPA